MSKYEENAKQTKNKGRGGHEEATGLIVLKLTSCTFFRTYAEGEILAAVFLLAQLGALS